MSSIDLAQLASTVAALIRAGRDSDALARLGAVGLSASNWHVLADAPGVSTLDLVPILRMLQQHTRVPCLVCCGSGVRVRSDQGGDYEETCPECRGERVVTPFLALPYTPPPEPARLPRSFDCVLRKLRLEYMGPVPLDRKVTWAYNINAPYMRGEDDPEGPYVGTRPAWALSVGPVTQFFFDLDHGPDEPVEALLAAVERVRQEWQDLCAYAVATAREDA